MVLVHLQSTKLPSQCLNKKEVFFFSLQVVLSPDSKWLFSASGDIRVWSVPKMIQQMQSHALSQKHCCAVAGLTMQNDGSKAFAVSSDQTDGKPNGGLQFSIWETWTSRTQICFDAINMHNVSQCFKIYSRLYKSRNQKGKTSTVTGSCFCASCLRISNAFLQS